MVADRSVSVAMTLGDLEKGDAMSQFFPTDLRNYSRTV